VQQYHYSTFHFVCQAFLKIYFKISETGLDKHLVI
jgi:hypothetical protein